MKPAKYIASDRRGEKAHQIEIEAMVNPFLAEALDGYEAVDGDHRANIERLEVQIEECAQRNPTRRWLVIIGTVVLVALVAVAAFFFIDRSNSNIDYVAVAETTEPASPLDSPVMPDTTAVVLIDSAALVAERPARPRVVVDTLAVVALKKRVVEAPVQDLESDTKVDDNERLGVAGPKSDNVVAADEPAKPQDSTAQNNTNKQLSNSTESTPQDLPSSLPSASLESAATFRGGDIESFRTWVEGRVKAPNMALASTLSKPIVISFVVNENGKITDVDVLQNPDNQLTEQVVKAVKRSPRWEPARHEGRKVASKFSLVTRPEKWPNK